MTTRIDRRYLTRAELERAETIASDSAEHGNMPATDLDWWEAEGRRTRMTVHDRFQVGCSYCGHLSAHQTRNAATVALWNLSGRHATCGKLTIFDVMARRGAPELWDARGYVLELRRKKVIA